MRLLLDSHVLLWLYGDPARLLRRAMGAIRDEANEKLVSAATVWEAEVKRAAGRLVAPQDLPERVRASGFVELPVRFSHGVAAAALPRLHGDPFDRMLVAQAQVEGMTIVTADRAMARYDVPVLRAA